MDRGCEKGIGIEGLEPSEHQVERLFVYNHRNSCQVAARVKASLKEALKNRRGLKKCPYVGCSELPEAVRCSKYLGRALWRKWSSYYRRSRVKTKMFWVKLLGQRLSARDFDRQGYA